MRLTPAILFKVDGRFSKIADERGLWLARIYLPFWCDHSQKGGVSSFVAFAASHGELQSEQPRNILLAKTRTAEF
jgi:hypothetical protein